MTTFLKIIGVLEIVVSIICIVWSIISLQHVLLISSIFNGLGGIALYILGETKENVDSALYRARENADRITKLEKLGNGIGDENQNAKPKYEWVKFSDIENSGKGHNRT